MKWIAPALVYLAVGVGIFQLHSAWGALLGFHLAIISSLLIARPDLPVTSLFKGTNNTWVFLSILLCGSSGISLYLLWNIFGVVNELPAQVQALGLNTTTWPAFIAYFAVVNPFVEEYFWRGYLGSPTKSLHVSDLLYAGFHGLILIGKVPGYSIMFGLSVLVLAGWLWRQIARADQGLRAPVLGHMAADFSILITAYIMTK
jgi:hypothetical protein